jgi:hypothetical protein
VVCGDQLAQMCQLASRARIASRAVTSLKRLCETPKRTRLKRAVSCRLAALGSSPRGRASRPVPLAPRDRDPGAPLPRGERGRCRPFSPTGRRRPFDSNPMLPGSAPGPSTPPAPAPGRPCAGRSRTLSSAGRRARAFPSLSPPRPLAAEARRSVRLNCFPVRLVTWRSLAIN